jgi:hypothetical protein
MRSLHKFLMIGLTTFGLCASGTWRANTFQKNGLAYGFGNGGANVASFSNPYGLAVGSPGVFVADTDNQVLKMLTDPIAPETAVAGGGVAGNANAIGVAAEFNGPSGLAINPVTRDLFVAAMEVGSANGIIRRILTPSSTDVSSGPMDPIWNVTSPLAGLAYVPQNLMFEANTGAKLYVSGDNGNVYKYDTTTWALDDTFTTGGLASGMAFDASGNLYVTADHGIYKLNAATLSGGAGGAATLIAGDAGANGATDGAGLTARFDAPFGITFDPISGNLYVADTNNNTIRQLSTSDGGATWTVSTIAGTAGVAGDADGATPTFNAPTGIAFGPGGLYITDAGDGGVTSNGLVRLLTFIPTLPTAPASIANSLSGSPESGAPPSFAHVTAAAGESIGHAAEATVEVNTGGVEAGASTEGDSAGNKEDSMGNSGDVEKFHMSPQRLKMDIRALNNGALVNYDKSYGDYGSMLKALESSLGATKAMANIGNGMSLWVSGVYAQGRNKAMFTNPAGADKHYGIMAGTHYYHKPTRQLIGIAFDVGLGGSRANTDHKLKSAYRSAEVTGYYSYGFTKKWKVNLQLAHMLVRANNHRPYGTSNSLIATSRAKSTVTSGSIDTDYKFKPSKAFHLRPSIGLRVGRTEQAAYSEKDAGANNMHFRTATMTEVALKTGFKVSIFYKKDDVTTYSLYPEVNYTRYVKSGKMRQKAGLVNSGTVQLLESGTPGKNLVAFGLGAGVTNTEENTKYQVGYTASFQKYRKSHEVMFKGSWPF